MLNKYEAHITVAVGRPDAFVGLEVHSIKEFQEFCREHRLKFLEIELDRGENIYQPMTSSFHQGTEEMVKTEIFVLANKLALQGFGVLRIKIEANIDNSDLSEDNFIYLGDVEKYFEAHFLVTCIEDRLQELQDLCHTYSIHVSRSVRSKSYNRFVTLRVYNSTPKIAKEKISQINKILQNAGFEVTKTIREFVIFDSYLDLDRGW